MAYKRHTSFLVRIIESRLTPAVLLMVSAFVVAAAGQRFFVAQDMAARRSDVEAERARLEARRDALQADVEYLNTPAGQEEALRTYYDMAKTGEEVVILVSGQNENASSANATVPRRPQDSAQRSVWDWLRLW